MGQIEEAQNVKYENVSESEIQDVILRCLPCIRAVSWRQHLVIMAVESKSAAPLSLPCDGRENSGLCTAICYVGPNLQGVGLSSSFLMFPNENEIQWRGGFVINHMGYHTYDNIRAHFPGCISRKVYNAAKAMPEILQFRLINRLYIWPQIFQLDPPSFDDVAMYFLPSEIDRHKEKYVHLLEQMNRHDLALCCHLDGLELLVYTSMLLPVDPRKLNTELYLWGIFRHRTREKLHEGTRVHGEGTRAEVDMGFGIVRDIYVGRVDKPVAKPAATQRDQLNACGPASEQNRCDLYNSSTTLLKLKDNHKEQNFPDIPPGFSKPSAGGLCCKNGALVKFDLKKPIDHISSDIPPGFSRPVHLKCGRSFECAGKSPVPEKYDKRGPASLSPAGGCIISSSSIEEICNMPRESEYSAAAKPAETVEPLETRKQVYLDEKNYALKLIEEEVEYEEIEELREEVEEVEEEEESTVINSKNAEAILVVMMNQKMEKRKRMRLKSVQSFLLCLDMDLGSWVKINNIPRNVCEDDVKSFVEATGEVAEVRKMKCNNSTENKGHAFVTYRTNKLASKAITDLKNKECKVKELYINNLPKNVTIGKVKELFKHHGEITKVILPATKSGLETRFGIIHSAERSMAMKALENMEYELDGQVLECSLAYPPVEKKGYSDSNAQKCALLPCFPPSVGNSLFGPYGAIATAFAAHDIWKDHFPCWYANGARVMARLAHWACLAPNLNYVCPTTKRLQQWRLQLARWCLQQLEVSSILNDAWETRLQPRSYIGMDYFCWFLQVVISC